MLPRRVVQQYWKKRKYSQFSKHLNLNFMHRFGRIFLLLLLLVAAHTVAMMWFEALSLGDALWLSLTTITTVGYGDLSAATLEGRICSALFIYSVGITLLAQLGAEYVEYRLTIREKKHIGRWKWKKMNDHILIINTPKNDADAYLLRLIKQIRATPQLEEYPVQVLTTGFDKGLPEVLSDLGVVHYSGEGQNSDDLRSVNVTTARYIVVLAHDTSATITDSLTFDLLNRIQDLGSQALVLAEVCNDDNRERIKKAGAEVVVRPLRAYPGLVVRTLVAPGTEAIFENLFSHNDDHMLRFDIEFSNLKWSDIVCRCVCGGVGTPMAYISEQGIDVHPLPDTLCSGSALITMVNDNQIVTTERVEHCLFGIK